MLQKSFASATVALALLFTMSSATLAGNRSTGASVTACSTYGHSGCYSAPVRQTALGPQMRLKGGAWIWCEGDCRDTLRRATVDFWDDQRENAR